MAGLETRIFGVILAGGQGRRMGGADKAFLPLNGIPLIRRAVDRLGPQTWRLAISANGDPARFSGFGLDILPDQHPSGPLSGVLSALAWAAAIGADAVVSVPVDAPFLPLDLVDRLARDAMPGSPVLAASNGQDHPVFGLWPVDLHDDLADFLARDIRHSVRAFADAHQASRAQFPDDTAFINLNTREDLARATGLAESET